MVAGASLYTLYSITLCVLALIAYKDIKTFRIPNGSIVTLIVLWIASLCLDPQQYQYEMIGGIVGILPSAGEEYVYIFIDRLIAALCIAGGLLLVAVLYEQISGKYSFGGGDIKLLFAVSLFLGFRSGLMNVVVACCIGLIFAPIWRSFSGRQKKCLVQSTSVFPFGPAIAISSGLFLAKILYFG